MCQEVVVPTRFRRKVANLRFRLCLVPTNDHEKRSHKFPREEDFGVRVPGPVVFFQPVMRVYNPCFKIDVFHTFKRLSTGE